MNAAAPSMRLDHLHASNACSCGPVHIHQHGQTANVLISLCSVQFVDMLLFWALRIPRVCSAAF